MTHKHVALAFLAVLIGVSFASADTMIYTESAIASGSLGSTSFTDNLITLTAIGDTAKVFQPSGGLFFCRGCMFG
jgi:hypothetical protein